jgi:hypothetical protein
MTARKLVPALAALALVPAAPASADQAVSELGRESTIAAYGGWQAWSSFDESTGRYTLMLRDPSGAAKAAPIETGASPWDVSVGPGASGNVVAVYRSCDRGCDIRRLDLATGRDQALRAVSSPRYVEGTPAIWRSTVVFTRRIGHCDVPYVKDLGSSKPSRRLLRSRCLTTPAGHAAIRGSRIVMSSMDLSHTDRGGAGRKTSELRVYSSRASGSTVIDQVTFGEESNLYGQVALDSRFAYTLHYGLHPASAFVRVPLAGGAPQEVRQAVGQRLDLRRAPGRRGGRLRRLHRRPVPARVCAIEPVARAADADAGAHGRLYGPAAAWSAADVQRRPEPADRLGRQHRGHGAAGGRDGRALSPHRLRARAFRGHRPARGHRRRRQLQHRPARRGRRPVVHRRRRDARRADLGRARDRRQRRAVASALGVRARCPRRRAPLSARCSGRDWQ